MGMDGRPSSVAGVAPFIQTLLVQYCTKGRIYLGALSLTAREDWKMGLEQGAPATAERMMDDQQGAPQSDG